MMAHVDLCSGIGGFALGFQWAGLSKPVLFCDIEPWARQILEKHWPDVPIAENVKELANDPDGLIPRTDPKRTILTAGYPCQPFSHSGKRLGSADTDRHIWPYLLQIVAQKRPAWCCFENVYGHVSLGLDQVLLDLEAEGYATRTFIVPACAVDAPHRRNRVWIIAQSNDANTDSQRPHRTEQHEHRGGEPADGKERDTGQVREVLAGQRNAEERRAKDVAHTDSQRGRSGNAGRQDAEDAGQPPCNTRDNTRRMESWLTEPSVGRVAYGIPKRVDRLRGLGNAIVPQIAQKIGEAIKQCEAEL